MPTKSQLPTYCLILTLIALTFLLRHYLPRETAANVEVGVMVGVVGVAFGVGYLRKG